jgi:hypothetical protein
MEARALDDGFVYPEEHVVARLNVELAGPPTRSVRSQWSTAVLTTEERPSAGLRVSVAWSSGERGVRGQRSWQDRVREANGGKPVVAVESRKQLLTAV